MMHRRGVALLEITAAGVVLLALLAVALQFVSASAAQRRAIRGKQLAVEEAANVMERLSLRSWDELTQENLAGLKLSEEARQGLDGGEVQVKVTKPADDANARQIEVAVLWQASPDEPARSARLMAWRYKTKP